MDQLQPKLGELIAEAETLTARAEDLLRATERRSVIHEGAAILTQLLGAHNRTPGRVPDTALDLFQGDVERLQATFRSAAQRSAHFSYFGGLLFALPLVVATALGMALLIDAADVSGYSRSTFASVAIAGAIGATVSVMARMSSGRFRLDPLTGRVYIRLLGGMRPFLGAVFAVVLYFALVSDFLALEIPSSGSEMFFYTVLAFFAGFNERWAQDMLAFTGPGRDRPTWGPPTTAVDEQLELEAPPERGD